MQYIGEHQLDVLPSRLQWSVSLNTSAEAYHYAKEKSENINVIIIKSLEITYLNNSPVCDPAISCYTVKVEIPIKIVLDPSNLPHHVLVLAAGGGGSEAGGGAVSPEIVDGDVTIVQTNHDHVRVAGVDVE